MSEAGGPKEAISRSAGRSKPEQCLLGWPIAGSGNLGKFYLKADGMQCSYLLLSVSQCCWFSSLKIALKEIDYCFRFKLRDSHVGSFVLIALLFPLRWTVVCALT